MQEVKPVTVDQVLAALNEHATVAEAAKSLGMSVRTLYRRMDGFHIRSKRVVEKEAA